MSVVFVSVEALGGRELTQSPPHLFLDRAIESSQACTIFDVARGVFS